MIYHSSKDFRFIQNSKKCCVGFIDLVNSTVDTLSIINEVKMESYYSIFINSLTKIIRGYDGEVVKNIGDCLLFYFPKTSKSNNINEFRKVIECFLEILESRSTINEYLIKENLPPFSYRITVDYGTLNFALTGSLNQIDIFGYIVNICSKLNSSPLSIPNKLTIGDNLYHFLSSFNMFSDRYCFSFIGNYNLNEYNNYGLHIVTRNVEIYNSNNLNQLKDKDIEKKVNFETDIEKKVNFETLDKKVIIIIDDDKDVILTFKSILQNNNKNNIYDIITFTDPVHALKYLKQNYYSLKNNLLIILDIRMKTINGVQLYKQIKFLDSSIKILFITGLDIIDEIKCMIPGLTDDQIKKKPIEKKTLINTVKKLLDNPNIQS